MAPLSLLSAVAGDGGSALSGSSGSSGTSGMTGTGGASGGGYTTRIFARVSGLIIPRKVPSRRSRSNFSWKKRMASSADSTGSSVKEKVRLVTTVTQWSVS